MKNIYEIVTDLLKENERYLSNDGNLLKANIYSDAMTMNKELIEMLLNNEATRKKFFVEINNNYVFDKQGFAWFVEEKEFLPDSYTKYANKIGLTSNSKYINQSNDVVLDFPFKDCVLEGGQTKEDQKRSEIFFNEIIASDEISGMLAPKVFTNIKEYTKDGEKRISTFDEKNNLIIKGNNLIALASIMKKYESKVKCIYIDPPYNTGDDSFGYNDKFNRSSWLTFMKNRLELAKKLLKDDGLIFINIDDNEQAYLSVIADEIFGKDNAFDKISVQTSSSQGGFGNINPGLISNTENILIYVKNNQFKKSCFNEDNMYVEKEYDENYKYIMTDINKLEYRSLNEIAYKNLNIEEPYDNNTWRKLKKKFGDEYKKILFEEKSRIALENKDMVFRTYNPNKPSDALLKSLNKSLEVKNEIYIDKDMNGENRYILNGEVVLFYSKTFRNINNKLVPAKRLTTFWDDIAWEGIAKEGDVKLRNGKKPEKLMKRIIEISTRENDLILDYHIGSGTSCAVAHKINRRYIGIEQLNYEKNDSVVRLKNVINKDNTGISKEVNWNGGGSFVYCELKENGQELVNEVLNADENTINELKEKIIDDDRIISYITKNEIKKADKEFSDLSLKEKKKALIALIDKNKLYVNYSDLDDVNYNVTAEEKAFTQSFYEGV